jgi:hypothetical protein
MRRRFFVMKWIMLTLFSGLFFCSPGRGFPWDALGCIPTEAAQRDEARDDIDFTYDIHSMLQLNPDFSTYPGSNGVIWLKQVDYEIAPDGGIERKSLWILLGRKGLDPRWLVWNVPVPERGEAEILEAAVYSPRDGEKILDAGEFARNGGKMRSAVFSDLPAEFILVICYREFFPEKVSVGDVIWVGESLPVWEASLVVTVSGGHPFYYNSDLDVLPEISERNGRTVYKWRVINTPPVTASLRVAPRGYVAFGMKKGRKAAGRFLKNLETAPVPEPPAVVQAMMKKGVGLKSMENILQWLYRQPQFLLPEGATRKIPEEAPWTNREKTLLAYHWLKERGANIRLFWHLAYLPEEDKPVGESMATVPVLALQTSDRDVFYYDMEHIPHLRENSISLEGQTLYGVLDEKLEERRGPNSSASENRLNADFDLRLDEEGILTGTMRIVARKAWRRFLFPAAPASDDLALLMEGLFLQVPRYSDVKLDVSGRETVLSATLAPTQVIKGTEGRNILVSMPPLLPDCLQSAAAGSVPYALVFPFVLNTRFTLKLPASTMNVMLPTPEPRGMGKVKYVESYKFNKGKLLTADARMTVGTTAMRDDDAANFNVALQSWRNFMTRPLPVQLKAK